LPKLSTETVFGLLIYAVFFCGKFPVVQRAKSVSVAKMPGQRKIKMKGLLSNQS
jgi:hypothetical protein